jgi:hypothetical protein
MTTASEATAVSPQHSQRTGDADKSDGATTARAVLAVLAGLAVLVVAFANLTNVPRWAEMHGSVPVYLAFFLVMSIAGRLFWSGTDTLITVARRR